MSLNNFVNTIQEIMRKDNGVNGDAQEIEQITWMLFLKVYDSKESDWEFDDDDYTSIIPEELRWRNWAKDNKDGEALTGADLIKFVDQQLFPGLQNIEITPNTPKNKIIVKAIFEDSNNYMKNGITLRQVVNVIDELEFEDYDDRHAFGDIYEEMLQSLQSAGKAGEFYTPRAVTDFMAEMINPQLGEKIADFACGTGGFLTSALKILEKQVKGTEDHQKYNNSIYGIEKKLFPYVLCITNMLLKDLDNPNIIHANSFDRRITEYTEEEKYDIVLMNPPYGGNELELVQNNFPKNLRSSETADLFMSVIMYRLKQNGRAAVILPDGFLFGTDNIKISIKKKLMNEFNLHTIIRLPPSVFAPYTSIKTNILFFDNTQPTKETWIYRVDMPEGYKHFSKTKPMKLEHFNKCKKWWNNREEITIKEFPKAHKYTIKEIQENDYNLDLCKIPKIEEEILPPKELIQQYQQQRKELDEKIDKTLNEIKKILEINEE